MAPMSFDELTFNINHGYLEGLIRGFKGGILTQADYANLIQCETLEGCREIRKHVFIYSCEHLNLL